MQDWTLIQKLSLGKEVPEQGNAGRDWGKEEKGMPEDEMAGWHH